MIILRLKGGLGNQLFQTLYALKIANTNERISVDTSFYNYKFDDDYGGSYYAIEEILSSDTRARLSPFRFDPFLNRILWRIANILQLTNKRFLGLTLLDGYFQEASKFSDSHLLKNHLTLEPDQNFKIDANCVLIHVRKGDYTNSVNSKIYFNCDIEYFQKAILKISEKIMCPRFYIVSNDEKWVEENFNFLANYEILRIKDPIECFKVMCQFSNFIISNSTFSWWPAALSKNSLTIVPNKWFLNEENNRDIYFSDWIRV